MTGFGSYEKARNGIVVSLQVSSVNRKNLEVVCSLPKDLQQLDRKVQEAVRSVASRGRFQFSIDISKEDAAISILPDDEKIDAVLARLKEITERHGDPFAVDGHLLVQVSKLLEGEVQMRSDEAEEALFLKAVEEALKSLVSMREKEGEALKSDLKQRGDRLSVFIAEIKELAPEMVEKYRETLYGRLDQAGLELDISDERVLREIALFADRCDISEEITRLESHMEQYRLLLEKNEPVGRPLEFLLQEVGREINTTGSKTSLIEISKLVLEMKNELERIREQVANVE